MLLDMGLFTLFWKKVWKLESEWIDQNPIKMDHTCHFSMGPKFNVLPANKFFYLKLVADC